MKYHLFFFLCLLMTSPTTMAQIHDMEIENLVMNEQYDSAWQLLDKNYSNDKSENVITKTDFCLRYFSQTRFHQNFNFNNLVSSHNLLDFRKLNPSADTKFYSFNPEKELNLARAREPLNFKINLALGDYYHEVFLSYKNEWIKPKNEVEALFYYHYMEAYKHLIKSDRSLFALGVYQLSKQNLTESIQYLHEALKLNPIYASAQYNLAYCYSQMDSINMAIYHANQAFDLYQTKELKSDAASMIGILLMDQKKYEDGINWLLTSDALSPGNFFVYESLLKSYLQVNKMSEANLIAKNLYYFDWKNAKIFNSIEAAFISVNKQKELHLFLEERLKERQSDKEYQGFVYIYLTQLCISEKHEQLAKNYLNEAIQCFSICYDKDHSIFKALENLKKSI